MNEACGCDDKPAKKGSATVEVMPQIKDGAAEDKENTKKNKKYILKAMKSQKKAD